MFFFAKSIQQQYLVLMGNQRFKLVTIYFLSHCFFLSSYLKITNNYSNINCEANIYTSQTIPKQL